MNLTLQDVLSHPVFNQFVTSKKRLDLENVRNMLMVLEKYDKVRALYRTHNLKDIEPNSRKEGLTHFKACPWSNEECLEGPDTCVCSYVSSSCWEIIDMLDNRFVL